MAIAFQGFDCEQALARLARWPLFQSTEYLDLHPDVRGGDIGAAEHCIRFGCWEGRLFATERRLAARLANVGSPSADLGSFGLGRRNVAAIAASDIGVYVNSKGNFFMREIAHLLASGLRSIGVQVTEGDDETPPEQRRPHSVVVAPHEFFLLGKGGQWMRQDVVTDCIMLSTEQPQTQWFAASLPYLLSCRGVLEMCWQTSETLLSAGVPSSFYLPGLPADWSPNLSDTRHVADNILVSSLPEAALTFAGANGPLNERPIDVTFMATESAVRDDFLSRHLTALSQLQTVLLYRRGGAAVAKPYAADEDIAAVNNFVLRRSKILLSVHRDTLGYFEIHRLGLQGFWNNCAVVTNRCLPHPYFRANQHYFEESLDRIPKLLRWLIGTPEGRREAETVRWRALKQYVAMGDTLTQSLRVLEFLGTSFGFGAAQA